MMNSNLSNTDSSGTPGNTPRNSDTPRDADVSIRGLEQTLPCSLCEEWLHLYLEGEADSFTSRAVSRHLAACPACAGRKRELETERIEFLEAAVVNPPLSSRFAERVVAEIRRSAAVDADRRRIVRLRWLSAGGLGAAAALVVMLALTQWSGRAPSAPDAGEISSVGGGVGTPPRSCETDPVPHPGSRHPIEIAKPLPAPRAAPAGRTTLGLNHSIEFSASILSSDDVLPCSRDVNHDGQTNVSDAAHLFMLAVGPPPDSLRPTSGEELDLDCNSLCRA